MRIKQDEISARTTDAAISDNDKVSLQPCPPPSLTPVTPPSSEQLQSPVPLSCICKSFMGKSQDPPPQPTPLPASDATMIYAFLHQSRQPSLVRGRATRRLPGPAGSAEGRRLLVSCAAAFPTLTCSPITDDKEYSPSLTGWVGGVGGQLWGGFEEWIQTVTESPL